MQLVITEGEYANESEYIRDLVRKDRERNARLRNLQAAIDAGLESGESEHTVTDVMRIVKEKLKKNGQL